MLDVYVLGQGPKRVGGRRSALGRKARVRSPPRLCENAFAAWRYLIGRCAKGPGFQPRMAAMNGPAPRIAITRFML